MSLHSSQLQHIIPQLGKIGVLLESTCHNWWGKNFRRSMRMGTCTNWVFSDRMLINERMNGENVSTCNRHFLLPELSSAFLLKTRAFSMNPRRIVNSCPNSMQPYLKLIRIDRPAGTWLLFWPCAWGVAIATDPGTLPDVHMLTLFGLGAFLMRGAGCIVNDMWDKDLDRQVERTKCRPLASGQLAFTPALVWLAGQLGLSLLVLLQLNWSSILLGAGSLGLVFTYPLFKRFTYYPQVVLGMALNWGVLLGFTAIRGFIDPVVVIPLYLAGLCWTIIYDTIYAHQDKADDAQIGVKSTALKFGDQTPTILWEFSTSMIFALGASGYMAGLSWPFFVGLAGVGAHLTYQTFTVDINDPEDCMQKFRSNVYLGLLIFLSIVSGNLLRTEESIGNREKLKQGWIESILQE